MFKDADQTIFVGRREDGTIYGLWTVRQWPDQEEMLASSPEILAFVNKPARRAEEPKPTSKISDDPRLKVIPQREILKNGS